MRHKRTGAHKSSIAGSPSAGGSVVGKLLGRLSRWAAYALVAWVIATTGLVLALRWIDPPTSAFMLRERAHMLVGGSDHRLRYEWVDLGGISPHAALAVIAAEDQRFPQHWGFDLQSIRDAVAEGERRGKVRGASTISQQVAKNLFLWRGRSFVRKGLEAWFTVLIEALWPKRRILEVYLNIAEFGPGVYGAEAAARRFYRKPAAKLTSYEAALMAAVLPNPRRLRIDRPSRYVASRRAWIMDQMHGLGGSAFLMQLDAPPRGRRSE
jgi:monofunctional biosynthetic peptidoglycan transglycosylase